MKKILFRSSLILFIALYLPLHSMAWGMLGHRIVGQIADSYLTDKARAEIKKILGHETIAMASNYADFIKADSNYKYLDPWHYVNFPKGLSFQEYNEYLKVDTIADAYTKINFLSKQLKKKGLSKDQKVFYLKMLIHVGEDIAQPLHASAEGTRGGNDIKVQWFSNSTNLHSVWDSYIIDDQKLSYTEYANAINFSTREQRKAWRKGGLKEWLYDSYIISQQLQDEIKTQNPRLGYEYTYNHLALLNKQLLKGGVRLASLLNSIFQ